MASKRSTRLQNQDTLEVRTPAEVSSNDKKTKARASEKKTTKSAVNKRKRASKSAEAQSASSEDALSSLTPELLYIVLDNVSNIPKCIYQSEPDVGEIQVKQYATLCQQ